MLFKCPICHKEYEKLLSLSLHFRKLHKKTARELRIALFHPNDKPTCKCGCGEDVAFLSIEAGFREYRAGHKSRVSNNFQTEKSISNSLAKRRKMIQEGVWKPFVCKDTDKRWAEGRTAETDDRLAAAARKRSELYGQKYSDLMRLYRQTGIIPTMRGDRHSQWKGGISPLNTYCRTNPRLYTEWKYQKLVLAGFKCECCGCSGKLNVHHDKETFAEIYIRIATEYGWDKQHAVTLPPSDHDSHINQLKQKVSDAVADYHIKNNISAKVLCPKCHRQEHKLLITKNI